MGREGHEDQPSEQIEAARSRTTVSVQTSGLTEQNCKVSNVQVNVNSKKGHKTVQT